MQYLREKELGKISAEGMDAAGRGIKQPTLRKSPGIDARRVWPTAHNLRAQVLTALSREIDQAAASAVNCSCIGGQSMVPQPSRFLFAFSL
jgi:hypothetical protein